MCSNLALSRSVWAHEFGVPLLFPAPKWTNVHQKWKDVHQKWADVHHVHYLITCTPSSQPRV